MRAAAVLACSFLAACSFQGSFGEGYRCGEGDRCPAGQSCVDGFCVAGAPPDAGGDVVDGDVPDAQPPAASCGTISWLRDAFDDGARAPTWWDWFDPGVTVDEVGSELVIDIPSTGTGELWGGYMSAFRFDLRGGVFDVDVAEAGAQYTTIEVVDPDDVSAQLYVFEGTLTAAVRASNTTQVRVERAYDPVDDRYWRLREDGGRLYWETSADRTSGTLLHDEPVPLAPGDVAGVLAAGGAATAATTSRFSDVNLDTPDPGMCAAATIVDDFATPGLYPRWDWWEDTGCTVEETAGVLRMSFDGAGEDWCGVSSTHLVDLRESEYVVETASLPGGTDFIAYVQVVPPGGDPDITHLEISRVDGELGTEHQVDGVDVAANWIPFDPTNHRFWRLRAAGSQVFVDTSPDGAQWTNVLTDAVAFDLSAVYLTLAGGSWNAGPGAPITIDYQAVNP